MKCHKCKQAAKPPMVFVYTYPDGHTEIDAPSDKLVACRSGTILHCMHRKCWRELELTAKRAANPQNVTGKGYNEVALSEEANAAARARLAAKIAEREADTGHTDQTQRMSWPAGGQVDIEL